MAEEAYTITLQPDERRYVHVYEPRALHTGAPGYGLAVTDVALLPEEVANEARVSRYGYVFLSGFRAPTVDHFEGWGKLETELRRMEVTNRRPDDLFENAVLEVTFSLRLVEPRRGSRFTTPLVVLPISTVRIVGYEDRS